MTTNFAHLKIFFTNGYDYCFLNVALKIVIFQSFLLVMRAL